MSGLAALLAGHRKPGIYRWSSALDVAHIRRAVEHARWRFVSLDSWQIEDKKAFLEATKDVMGFPDDFGHNFDALADSLNDVTHPDGEGVLVLWDGWGPFARADRKAFDVAVDVLSVRARSSRHGKFIVLMRGPGPEIDVPEVYPHAG
jgi:RNAse (barnase) inhibitor barstar